MDIEEDNEIELINNKSEEELLNYKYKNKTIRDIIDAIKKNISPYGDIYWTNSNEVYILMDKSLRELEIIFPNPIVVKYEVIKRLTNKKQLFMDLKVFSTLQIDEFLKTKHFKNPTFEIQNRSYNYFESKFKLKFINKNLTIKNIMNDYQLYQHFNIINKDEIIKREDLSTYFNEYFIYPISLDKGASFVYYESKSRDNLYNDLIEFINHPSIYIFKISGPPNDGKSTTLLYLSRNFINIIYLNVKCLEVLYSKEEYSKYLNLLIYEFGRIKFSNTKQSLSFENIFNDNIKQPYWKIIEELCLYLKKEHIKATIIFDEYKDKRIHFPSFKNITDFFNTDLKIILCSSINDKEIENEVINTITKFKGNPSLNLENQDYYFYYSDLIDTENLEKKNEIYNNIFFLDEMENYSKSFGIELEVYLFNIYRNVNKDLYFNEDLYILYMIPLKYCKLIFKGNIFEFKYRYKIIEEIVNKNISKINTQDYFEKKLYNKNEFYDKMKADFFEFSACESLKQIKDSLFDQKISYSLNVKSIEKMEFDKNNIDLNDYLENNENEINVMSFDEIKLDEKYEDLIDKEITCDENEKKNIEVEENEKDIHFYFKTNCENEKKIFSKKKRLRIEEEENINNQKSKSKKSKKEKSEIDEKEMKTYIEFNEDFKNEGIILNQTDMNGKVLDVGFLVGPLDEKEFIGIQIKFDEFNSYKLSKSSIKNKIQQLLVNCYKNLQIKIKKWHYIFCMYYNDLDDFKYNTSLKSNCEEGDIHYIFYNPVNNLFYDRNFSKLSKINLDYRSNLDNDSNSNPYIILKDCGYLENYSKQREDFSTKIAIDEKFFGYNKEDILQKIKNLNMNNYEFDFICKFKYELNFHLPTPQNSYFFLLKGENNNLFYYYNLDGILKCGQLESKEEIKPIKIIKYIEIEDDSIFYVLKITKNN